MINSIAVRMNILCGMFILSCISKHTKMEMQQTTGLVYDSRTKEPIEEARVVRIGNESTEDIAQMTNEKGIFILNSEGKMPFRIEIHHDHYKPKQLDWNPTNRIQNDTIYIAMHQRDDYIESRN